MFLSQDNVFIKFYYLGKESTSIGPTFINNYYVCKTAKKEKNATSNPKGEFYLPDS